MAKADQGQKRRVRGEARYAGWGKPLPADNRPEKVERGRQLVEAISGRGMGKIPLPPQSAVDALLKDLEAAETLPEWQIEKAARNGGVHGTRRPPTPRQVEFAQGYANGESGNEMARRLGVKMESVSRGLERLQFNLDARSRYQAIAMLVAAGYCSAPPLPDYTSKGRGERARPLVSRRRTVLLNEKRRKAKRGEPRDSLTDRELSELQLAANGATMEDIALANGVSVETVKTRRRRILAILGADGVTHAVAIALRQGIIT